MSGDPRRPRESRHSRSSVARLRAAQKRMGAHRITARSLSAWQLRYGVALVAVSLAWISRESLLPEAGDRSPFLAFGLAVLITAIVGGLGPGLLATGLSATIAAIVYLPPKEALAIGEPFDAVRLALFSAEGLAAAFAGGFVRRAVLREESMSRSAHRFARFVQQAEAIRDRRPARATGPIEGLTNREREVARMLALGLGNDEIAEALYVSRNTVKTHLKNIYGKLGVSTRTEAVARCIELGLLDMRASDDGKVL